MNKKRLERQKRTMQRLIKDYKEYNLHAWYSRQRQTASHILNLSKKHAELRNIALLELDMWQIAEYAAEYEYAKSLAERGEKDLLQIKMNSR